VKNLLLLSVLILTTGSMPVYAQNNSSGWSFEITPFKTQVYGNDVHVGDEFSYYEKYDFTKQMVDLSYGVDYKPVLTRMNPDGSLSYSANYRKGKWGFEFSVYDFEVSGSADGAVKSPQSTVGTASYQVYLSGVRFWDQSLAPVTNHLNENNGSPFFAFSDVDYWARNKLSLKRKDILATRYFGVSDKRNINLGIGLRFLRLENYRNEGLHQRAFLYDNYWDYFNSVLGHFDNDITLESSSLANHGNLIGPVWSLGATPFTLKRLSVSGYIREAILFGRREETGNWKDVDDIWIVTGPRGGPFNRYKQYAYFEGNFPLQNKDKTAIWMNEAKTSVTFKLNRFLDVGTTFYFSYLSNVQSASKWSVPGEWKALGGSGWQETRQNLIVWSFAPVFFKVKF